MKDAKVVGLAAGLGCSVVASLVVFVAVGLFIDKQFDKTPIFTLIGVGLGLVVAGYQLYELVLASDKNKRSGPIGRTMAQRIEARQKRNSRPDA